MQLPSGRFLTSEHHAGGVCLCNQSILLIGNVAFHVADAAAPLHHRPLRFELCLPDRAKEIDLEFDGSKGLVRSESACKRYTHRRVGNIAKNAAVKCAHRICVLRSCCEKNGGPPLCNILCVESHQTRHGHVVRQCPFSKIAFHRSSLSIHDLAPVFFRARTFASMCSSRWRQARLRSSSFRWRRLNIRLPSSVVMIRMANSAASTSERISAFRWPSSTIDCKR